MDPATFQIPADPRMSLMIAGFENGQPIPMTPDRFGAVADTWEITPDTPEEITNLLRVVKALYRHGFFVYEFVTVAVQHSFTALEAALAIRLDRPNDSLGALIKRAHQTAVLTDADHEVLYEAARPLRNGFGHARNQQVWTLGMAVPVIERVFTTVASLWPSVGETTAERTPSSVRMQSTEPAPGTLPDP